MNRYTLDGSAALETHLRMTCGKVLDGVRMVVPAARLEGLLLGGGYGRGEGGVLRTPEGDRPYNDLEFYVFIRGNALLVERQFHPALHELGETLSPAAGLEVEFKVLTRAKLQKSPPSMFYYDLVAGHRWLSGDERLLADCARHRDASRIPLHEATRLLFNRCSGLLFALERLQRPVFDAADADFTGRNLAKAQLALGDVWLTAHGLYDWSCRERQSRLAGFAFAGEAAWAKALVPHHEAGVEFKLHPVRSTAAREELSARHTELSGLARRLWLWLESRRLGKNFDSPADYAASRVDKCPETNPLRNRLVNARASGPAGLIDARYPRERLFHALVWLLWTPAGLVPAARELGTDAKDLAGLVAAYGKLWGRFN